MNNTIELSPELMGALITEKTDLSQNDVNQYLKTNNIKADARIAENTVGEVNICLPYYSWLDDVRAQSVGDDNMTVSGGDHLQRLAPTPDPSQWHFRNYGQLLYNLAVIFDHHRPDLADHSYDGDFDYHRGVNTVADVVADNPK